MYPDDIMAALDLICAWLVTWALLTAVSIGAMAAVHGLARIF